MQEDPTTVIPSDTTTATSVTTPSASSAPPTNTAMPSPLQPPQNSEPTNNQRHILLKILAIVGIVAIVGNGTGLVFWLHARNIENHKQTYAYRQQIVRKGLIDMLSVKSVHQTAKYTDTSFRTINYSVNSDFSNALHPLSKGTISVYYTRGRTIINQTLEFVAYDGNKGSQQIYFRMVKGNSQTNAPTNWFRGYNRDIRSLKAFENFWWLKYGDINSIEGTVIVGNLHNTTAAQRVIDKINDNEAYVFNSCGADEQTTWCSGKLNIAGVKSLQDNAGASEGTGLDLQLTYDNNASGITVWANNNTPGISKVQYNFKSDDAVYTYSNINKPGDVSFPKDFTNAPPMEDRATVDDLCNTYCQQLTAKDVAAQAAGTYYTD